jgi:exopolysaccharide biosynthesis polyprenyl glycosylphosphotransferase
MSAARQGAPTDPALPEELGTPLQLEGGDAPEGPGVPASAFAGFRRVAASLVLADACSIVGALLVVHAGNGNGFQITPDLILVLLVAPLAWVGTFHLFGLYGIRHLSPPEELRRLISATTLAVVVIVLGSIWWEDGFDRASLALTWLVALIFELIVRRLARWHVRRQKGLGRLALRTLIVGTNDEGVTIAKALSPPGRGFVPIGFVTSSADAFASNPGLPLVGSISDLASIAAKLSIECVFVASTATSPDDVYRISRACRDANIEMRVSANAPEVLTSRVSIQQVHNLMVLAVRPMKLTRTQATLKRSSDLLIASVCAITLLPVMLAIALAIKVTTRGPILFRQARVTKGGRSFTMYKFRTMVIDPERALDGRIIDLTKPFFKMPHDPRLTRIGRLLRSLSLDELPQLWNVLRGDMSLVGPRPLPAEQVTAHLDLLQPRHEVRAGITGWWQVSGRSDVGSDEAIKMDMFYIENWSLALDLYVLLKTMGAVIHRRGAY